MKFPLDLLYPRTFLTTLLYLCLMVKKTVNKHPNYLAYQISILKQTQQIL